MAADVALRSRLYDALRAAGAEGCGIEDLEELADRQRLRRALAALEQNDLAARRGRRWWTPDNLPAEEAPRMRPTHDTTTIDEEQWRRAVRRLRSVAGELGLVLVPGPIEDRLEQALAHWLDELGKPAVAKALSPFDRQALVHRIAGALTLPDRPEPSTDGG